MALRGILSVAKSSRMLPLVRQASSDPPVIKPLAMLTYEFIDGMAGRRTPHREAHLAHVTEAAEKGDLLIGGALEELDGGVMVFTSPDKAEAFAVKDPYVQNDLVVGFSVRGWSVVAGSLYGNIDK